ncbi:aldo/keto reductase [Aliiroseovarius sp. YM-037]|uniref:aldo/keto reductase n=1 Tax=Aliiroseovarius sp. YM-037 TaxID=3341728 RepID=UPI003A7F6B10
MKFLDTDIQPLGMGCWPIGGAMYSGEESLGYTKANDDESIRTIHAALDRGITLFDTAAAYGAGHSERLLAHALTDRPDAVIVTKIGIAIDEDSKQLTFGDTDPKRIIPAIDQCLDRLGRDCVDLMLLHDNKLAVSEAEAVFDEMEKARNAGKIRAYGWSTDFSASVKAVASRPGFAAVEHAMNVFVDVPQIQDVVDKNQLHALIRSPLAMGLLTGKYGTGATMQAGDIRASSNLVIEYFKDTQANPYFLKKLDAVRELLTVDGRSLVQGAIGWLWAKNGKNIPIPGARTVEQIEGIAGALDFGALPKGVVVEIDGLIGQDREAGAETEL